MTIVCVRVQAQEFAKVLVPLFKQLAKCLNSSHFQVRFSSPGAAALNLSCERLCTLHCLVKFSW